MGTTLRLSAGSLRRLTANLGRLLDVCEDDERWWAAAERARLDANDRDTVGLRVMMVRALAQRVGFASIARRYL